TARASAPSGQPRGHLLARRRVLRNVNRRTAGEAPSRKVQIDVRLDEVVLRALEKNPELRFQQASEVKTQVETIALTPRLSSPQEAAAVVERAVTTISEWAEGDRRL